MKPWERGVGSVEERGPSATLLRNKATQRLHVEICYLALSRWPNLAEHRSLSS